MTPQEAIKQLEIAKGLIHKDGQDWLDERDFPVLDIAIEALKRLDAPDINVGDMISRQAAIDALGEEPPVWYDGEDEIAEQNQWRRDLEAIKNLPSVQPELPSYVAEIEEEYQKAVKTPYIRKPLANALHEVWKKHDREDAERRADE